MIIKCPACGHFGSILSTHCHSCGSKKRFRERRKAARTAMKVGLTVGLLAIVLGLWLMLALIGSPAAQQATAAAIR